MDRYTEKQADGFLHEVRKYGTLDGIAEIQKIFPIPLPPGYEYFVESLPAPPGAYWVRAGARLKGDAKVADTLDAKTDAELQVAAAMAKVSYDKNNFIRGEVIAKIRAKAVKP